MARQDRIKTWLEETKKKYPHIRGSRLDRFVEAVKSSPSFQYILDTSAVNQVGDGVDEVDGGAPADQATDVVDATTTRPDPDVGVLHAAARTGCCAILINDKYYDENRVNLADENGVTALHIAADFGNYEDVKVLLKAKAKVTAEKQGLTPLHFVSSSTEPNWMIAKRLVKYMKEQTEREETGGELMTAGYTGSDESLRGNTALHFAAENEQISREFIQALESIDPVIRNENDETAFHVAGRAEDPDVIVSMLEVFTPAKKGWVMRDIESKKGRPTLLEICARRGNAKAVALLIKYGADITDKVLFELVDESVNNPAKTDRLIGVYRTITENCVLWKWLKNTADGKQPRRRTEPTAYKKAKGEIMLSLLTKPNKDYSDKEDNDLNILEYTILNGDKVFLNEIVNTADVFKMTENRNEVEYDVTNFLTSSLDSNLISKYSRHVWLFFWPTAVVAPENQRQSTAADERMTPRRSYLYRIIQNGHLWENTDILHQEPFLTITQPICVFVRLIYFVMALIQLLHMIVFSIYYMPPYCSLKHQLINPNSLVQCNSSTIAPEPSVVSVSLQSYAMLNFLWLLWPTAVFFVTVIIRFPHRKWARRAYGYLTPRVVFAPVLWAWYVHNVMYGELHLWLTSAVYLSGWLVTLSFFIHTSENASVFSFLLKEIIVKDIVFGFGIVFVFVLISFSSAIHVLRQSALLGQDNYFDTFYNMFTATLTAEDFVSDRTNDTVHSHLLRVMFAVYLCCATIILLNILISMMNNRYDDARKTAKNLWRFQAVHTWISMCLSIGFTLSEQLYSFRIYWKFVTKFEASIVETDKVFLHLKHTKRNENADNQQSH